MDSFHIWYKWSQAWEGMSHVMTFDLDLYLQGHSTLFWLGIRHDSIVWVIMRQRGVSSEHRRSSCSSFIYDYTVIVPVRSHICIPFSCWTVTTQCGDILTRSIFSKSSSEKTHSLPVRARYVTSFVSLKSDLYSAVPIALLDVVSWYIVSCYNGTRLYMHNCYLIWELFYT